MKPSQQPSIDDGRIPWRSAVQLRRQPEHHAALRPLITGLARAAQRAAPPEFPDSWQRLEAKRRLVVVCDWLEECLARPIRVRRLGGRVRRIEVFEALTFTIDPKERFIASGELRDGENVFTSHVFEVGRPLITPLWLGSVLQRLCLYQREQGDLFFEAGADDAVQAWITQTAYRLLLREPRFRALRRVALPKAFALPAELHGIALASRTRPTGPLLTSRELNLVWRNLSAFRSVARENPQFLPLLMAYVRQIPPGEVVNCKDPVAALKAALRELGLSEAAWRYVVRHGARVFRIPWEISTGVTPFEAATIYLRALDAAGLPPPPPPQVARALLHGYNQNTYDGAIILKQDFHRKVHSPVLRAGLLEASRRRRDADLADFVEQFLGVCWWSEEPWNHLLDKNQLKRGWPWLVRQWQKDEAERAFVVESENRFWETRLQPARLGPWLVVPIDSSLALFRESVAMRNCLVNFREDCAHGNVEIYSVRDPATGKREGCIGFSFEGGLPSLFEIKGFANTPPGSGVRRVARALARRLHREWG